MAKKIEIPEFLLEKAGSLTYGEKKALKEQGIEWKKLTDIDTQDDAIAVMLELRGVKDEDVDDLNYGVLLKWLGEIFNNTFDGLSDDKKK